MLDAINKHLKEPFPFFFNNDKENLLLAAGVGLFCYLFFQVFQPFGLHNLDCTPLKSFTFSALTFLVLAAHVFAAPRLFPRTFDPDNWNLGKFILFFIWVVIALGFTISIAVYNLGWQPSQMSWPSLFLVEIGHSFTVGVIPLFILIYLFRTRMLAANLREAKFANEKLAAYHQELSTKKAEESDPFIGEKLSPEITPTSWIIYADTQDSLEIPCCSFIYAEADDNYTTIYWLENGQTQEKLLRLTLKNLESQFEKMGIEGLARIHRSYYVNLLRVSEVRGNASGYRLFFIDTDAELPVSRMKSKWVLHQLNPSEFGMAQLNQI
ncbi:MAG: hypothetical protein ACI959_000493 [Limisphaerales bacterium]|jgi:hypothetical protein